MSTKTIVIADDTAFVRDRFAAALAEAGHRAIGVATVPELLACLDREGDAIDLIVVDLQLPPPRGVGLVHLVQARGPSRAPILVFSGTLRGADEVRQLAGLGVAGYVNEYTSTQHILPCLAPYLFPDSFDRRLSPRVALAVPVSWRLGNAIASGVTLNVGKGGVGIRTMTPLEPGTLVRVRFRLPGASRDIEADARVRWADRNVGMGLQFEHLEARDQAALDEFVDGHFFSNRRA